MAIRVQKKWSALGIQKPGSKVVPNVGKIVEITDEHLARAAELGDPVVVLEHRDSPGLLALWAIEELRASE